MPEPLQLDAALAADALSLVIFLPDAVGSHLVGPVERWLRERTGCAPIARAWLTHMDEELRRFYPEVPRRFWPLISRAFCWGPSLVTLWHGERAAHVLPASKGLTEPGRCSAASVRGRFWCDNALANLLHVSDGSQDVARELGVLRSLQPELFRAPLYAQALAAFDDGAPPTPRHSAILTLCSLLGAFLATQGQVVPPPAAPLGESARETMARAEAWLAAVQTSLPAPAAAAVGAYLGATAQPDALVAALRGLAPLSEWQELLLTAGAQSRPAWREA